MCIVPAEKPAFMMILHQMTDILWQTAAAANGTTRKAWKFQFKFFEMRSTTCSENVVFTENKLYEFRPQKKFILLFLLLHHQVVVYMARVRNFLHAQKPSSIPRVFSPVTYNYWWKCLIGLYCMYIVLLFNNFTINSRFVHTIW